MAKALEALRTAFTEFAPRLLGAGLVLGLGIAPVATFGGTEYDRAMRPR